MKHTTIEEQKTVSVALPAPAGATFSASFESPKLVKTILEAVSFLIDETYMYVYPWGMKFCAIDSSHVEMLLASLPKELMSDYKCVDASKIGINIHDMVKILRRAKGSEGLQLHIDGKDPHALRITMKGDKSTRSFKLKSKEIPGFDAKEEGLLESFEETLKDKFTAKLVMETAVLDEIVKDATIISDLLKVDIASVEKTVNFTSSDESGEVDIQIDLDGKGVLDKTVKNDAGGIYSLAFLENIMKVQAISDSLEIELGNNIPLKFKATIPNSAGNPTEGKIIYLLAPRVEDQDNEDGVDGEIGDSSEEPEGESSEEGTPDAE